MRGWLKGNEEGNIQSYDAFYAEADAKRGEFQRETGMQGLTVETFLHREFDQDWARRFTDEAIAQTIEQYVGSTSPAFRRVRSILRAEAAARIKGEQHKILGIARLTLGVSAVGALIALITLVATCTQTIPGS